MPVRLALCLLLFAGWTCGRADIAAPGWTDADTRAILEQTLEVTLAPDLSGLRPEESAALALLLQAGGHVQDIYEDQKHPQALAARDRLRRAHAQAPGDRTRALLQLYRLAKGPVITNPQNERVAFLDVAAETPGRNVYPAGLTREAFAEAAAAQPALRFPRGSVRQAGSLAQAADRRALAARPGLTLLHPGLAERLAGASTGLYVAPYSLVYADRVTEIAALVREAASQLAPVDPDLAAYLRLRALDLLSENYEAGDAAWVLGRFGNLNVQLGSYETYDDTLAGVKAFYGMSLLVRDPLRTRDLEADLGGLQDLENQLPYARHKKVREDIPVGVYRVIADFGQARGANTATILPNDADHARKYGRTILLRYNIMTHPALFERARSRFAAATAEAFHADLTAEARFRRTLWHEIGHYLGVDRTEDGRSLWEALGENADLLEELKSDLVSSFSAPRLQAAGRYGEADVRGIYAAGVLRVLQDVRPRPDQPYQTMQLMQWNWLLDQGALAWDGESGVLEIDYAAFPAAVRSMLAEVLAIQRGGDPQRARAFVARWSTWDPDRHGRVAARIRAASPTRYTLMRYAALDEADGDSGPP
jgi:hypothetical protein